MGGVPPEGPIPYDPPLAWMKHVWAFAPVLDPRGCPGFEVALVDHPDEFINPDVPLLLNQAPVVFIQDRLVRQLYESLSHEKLPSGKRWLDPERLPDEEDPTA